MPETITVPKNKFDSMKETLEVVSDPKLMEDIREGIDDIRKGKTVSLDKYLKK
jgi:PHD/YefM family antitoxin component YafN of YafNO toxin-antitoxin module|tara:strand:- start:324 stop:482 length:159 start_codon:yes stop_codon:yes gene_type:complete